jgi:hypothetical protein
MKIPLPVPVRKAMDKWLISISHVRNIRRKNKNDRKAIGTADGG